MEGRSKNFEEVLVGIYKKDKQKQSGLGEEMSCYVDASRNIAVLLDSTALANERINKRLSGETASNVSPTLYYKQAKYFMSKKEYEKGLKYLYTAIGLCGTEEEREDNGTGKIISIFICSYPQRNEFIPGLMKDITFLNIIHKLKISFKPPSALK